MYVYITFSKEERKKTNPCNKGTYLFPPAVNFPLFDFE